VTLTYGRYDDSRRIIVLFRAHSLYLSCIGGQLALFVFTATVVFINWSLGTSLQSLGNQHNYIKLCYAYMSLQLYFIDQL